MHVVISHVTYNSYSIRIPICYVITTVHIASYVLLSYIVEIAIDMQTIAIASSIAI